MERINITCQHCLKVYSSAREPEIPPHVLSLGCNWCPSCEGQVDDYYEEWYNEDEGGKDPIPEPNNQLVFPFIFQEIEEKTLVNS